MTASMVFLLSNSSVNNLLSLVFSNVRINSKISNHCIFSGVYLWLLLSCVWTNYVFDLKAAQCHCDYRCLNKHYVYIVHPAPSYVVGDTCSDMSSHHNTSCWFNGHFITFHASNIGKERNHQSLCLCGLEVFVSLCQDTKVVRAQWTFCGHWVWTFNISVWKQKQQCISIDNKEQNALRLKKKINQEVFLHTVGLALSEMKISRFLRFLMLTVWIHKINK